MSVQASFTQLDSAPGSRPRPSRERVRQLCRRRIRERDERLRQAVGDLGIVEHAALGCQLDQLLQEHLVDDLLLEREVRAPLVGQRGVGHRPPVVLEPDEVVLGDEHVGRGTPR